MTASRELGQNVRIDAVCKSGTGISPVDSRARCACHNAGGFKMSDVIVKSISNLKNEVRYGNEQTLVTDEPLEAGGEDAGPDPYALLLAALGSCISMTVTLYAKRKAWPLQKVIIRLHQRRIHA